MATPFDLINQQLIQQGLAAGQPQQAPQLPTLFSQVPVGLFAPGVADPDLQNRLEDELGGFLGEGVFGKRGQRIRAELRGEQFSRDKEAADLFFEQSGVSIPDEQRDAVLQSGLGMQGLAALAQQEVARMQAEDPARIAEAQRAAAATEVTRARGRAGLVQEQAEASTAQLEAQEFASPFSTELRAQQQNQAMIAAQGGQFGSGLDIQGFIGVRDKLGRLTDGRDALLNLSDLTENLTPLQLRTVQGGRLIGEAEILTNQVLGAMQSLIEDRQSVLREGEREFFIEMQGNPLGLLNGIITRDERIMGRLQGIATAFQNNIDTSMVGLDQTTSTLLEPVLEAGARPFQTIEGEIRDPVALPGEPTPLNVGQQQGAGEGIQSFEDLGRLLGFPEETPQIPQIIP